MRKVNNLIIVASLFILTVFTVSSSGNISHQALAQQNTTHGITTRVSVASDGTQGNGISLSPTAISAEGRYVAFTSLASNLVPEDSNNALDVFVHDRQTGITTRVSVASDGTQANNGSLNPSVSADGRYIAFSSSASNLVPGDTNGRRDVFVHDQQTGTTTRVSIASDGTQGNSDSNYPSISANGRYVAFDSFANNLVPGDTSGTQDVFVHDRQTGITTRVSVASDGTQGNLHSRSPSISGDGCYVAFESDASNLVPGDTNGSLDVFVHDRQTGITKRVSVSSDGTQGNFGGNDPSISEDGRYVAFFSISSNLVPDDTNNKIDVFVHDRQTGITRRVSVASDGVQGDQNSGFPSISADGRYVAFDSFASSLVPGDTNDTRDVFVHDQVTGTTTRVSVASNGTQGNGSSVIPSISADGRYVAFESLASSLVPGDTNEVSDVFVHEREGIFEPLPVDLSIKSITPVQVIDLDLILDPNARFLVEGKSTAIKVIVNKVGTEEINNVGVSLSTGAFASTVFYVDEPGNRGNNNQLLNTNQEYFLNFSYDNHSKTIYFIHNQLAPLGSTFTATATVDPLNLIEESNEDNNSRSIDPPIPVKDTKWGSPILHPDLTLHYFRIDWAGVSQSVFHEFYDYSNNFIKGVFPVAESRYKPSQTDFGYIPSRLFRGLDGKFSDNELILFMMHLATRLRLSHPLVDKFVATVPPGWFEAYTHGHKSALGVSHPELESLVISEARTFNKPHGLSTVAHEIGHTYGLWIDCEQYDPKCNPDAVVFDNYSIGNYASSGMFVANRIPIELGQNRQVFSFMGSGYPPDLSLLEYWIDIDDYIGILQSSQVNIQSTVSSNIPISYSKAILASGLISKDHSDSILFDWYVLNDASLSSPRTGPYSFDYYNSEGDIVYQVPFDVVFTMNGIPIDQAPFVLTLPYIDGIVRVELTYNGVSFVSKEVSANSPSVTILTPNGGEIVSGITRINWIGSDVDEDVLSYAILVSVDNGYSWETITIGIKETEYYWDTTLFPPGSEYLAKIIVTDGFNTGMDESDATFTVMKNIYLPFVFREIRNLP
jgi:Tol biopolymer transport system component